MYLQTIILDFAESRENEGGSAALNAYRQPGTNGLRVSVLVISKVGYNRL